MHGVWVASGDPSGVFDESDEIVRDTVVLRLLDGMLRDFRPMLHFPGRMSTTTLVAGRPLFGTPPYLRTYTRRRSVPHIK